MNFNNTFKKKRYKKLYFWFKAPLKYYIWGGKKLKSEYSKETNLEIIAESWELSCHKDWQSIINNGEFKGKTLRKVLIDNKSFLGKTVAFFKIPPIEETAEDI